MAQPRSKLRLMKEMKAIRRDPPEHIVARASPPYRCAAAAAGCCCCRLLLLITRVRALLHSTCRLEMATGSCRPLQVAACNRVTCRRSTVG